MLRWVGYVTCTCVLLENAAVWLKGGEPMDVASMQLSQQTEDLRIPQGCLYKKKDDYRPSACLTCTSCNPTNRKLSNCCLDNREHV